MKNIIKTVSFAILAFLGVFTGTALAANVATSDEGSLLDLLKPVVAAFTEGKYLYAGMLALVLAVAAAKRYAPGKIGAWMHTDVGGTATTLVMSFAGALATTLSTGAGITWAMAKAAGLIAVGAAGGYAMIKKLVIEPFLKPLAAKAPTWAQPIFALVFWIFDKKTPVEKAEAAGEAAVVAKPAPGRGSVTEIE